MGLQWTELFLETTAMAKSMGHSELPDLVSSDQAYGKGTGMGSALFKYVDWISLKRYDCIIRERMVKSDRQISTNL